MHDQGHLLVLEGLPLLKLNHGLMEFEYTANYTRARRSQLGDVSVVTDPAAILDDGFRVAMTASMDSSGRLLLGTDSGMGISLLNGASVFEILWFHFQDDLRFRVQDGLGFRFQDGLMFELYIFP